MFGSILVLPGIMSCRVYGETILLPPVTTMVLVTAGAPLIRRAEYEIWRSGACGGGTILVLGL